MLVDILADDTRIDVWRGAPKKKASVPTRARQARVTALVNIILTAREWV